MPIYYVVTELTYDYSINGGYYTLIKSVEAVINSREDYDRLWMKEVQPLMQSGKNIQTFVFCREPENLFKKEAEKNARERTD